MSRGTGRWASTARRSSPTATPCLTHCNAGALATADYGTALAVFRVAAEQGKKIHVYADETRPRLQGMKLTAWELSRDSIPVTIICDNMAGWLMRKGKIQKVFVGADRIAANGDTANKIGTYSVAVLAKHHGIPFYVVAQPARLTCRWKAARRYRSRTAIRERSRRLTACRSPHRTCRC